MKRKASIFTLLILLLLAACTTTQPDVPESRQDASSLIKVYKSPSCDCCDDWIEYVVAQGYSVQVEYTQDIVAIKSHYQIPTSLYSCHTAIVAGYVIEGHVPAADIDRLLVERPDITGLAVPGMPIGSPGMEVEGIAAQPYDVIAFNQSGETSLFATYNN